VNISEAFRLLLLHAHHRRLEPFTLPQAARVVVAHALHHFFPKNLALIALGVFNLLDLVLQSNKDRVREHLAQGYLFDGLRLIFAPPLPPLGNFRPFELLGDVTWTHGHGLTVIIDGDVKLLVAGPGTPDMEAARTCRFVALHLFS
jgi:hypothetical protein